MTFVGRTHRLAEIGMPITSKILIKSVFSYASTNHLSNLFSKVTDRAGTKMVKVILSVHQHVSRRKAQHMNKDEKGADWLSITIVGCGNALQQSVPPFVLFKSQRLKPK